MLSRQHRLRSSRGFAGAIRRGTRAGTQTLVLHLDIGVDGTGPLVGFVVGKAVGNAVVRNQVRRRLRHIVRQRLVSLPATGVLVVRALPAAAGADFATLGADFDAALRRVLVRRTRTETA